MFVSRSLKRLALPQDDGSPPSHANGAVNGHDTNQPCRRSEPAPRPAPGREEPRRRTTYSDRDRDRDVGGGAGNAVESFGAERPVRRHSARSSDNVQAAGGVAIAAATTTKKVRHLLHFGIHWENHGL